MLAVRKRTHPESAGVPPASFGLQPAGETPALPGANYAAHANGNYPNRKKSFRPALAHGDRPLGLEKPGNGVPPQAVP